MKKIILGIFISISIPLFNPMIVRADNDDPSIPTCNISVGGARLVPGSKPNVYAKEKIGNVTYTYDFKVCVTDQNMRIALNNCLETGSQLGVGVKGMVGGWNKTWLEPSGGSCYEGVIESSSEGINKFDVETEGGQCDNHNPICRRVEANLQRILIDDYEECKQAYEGFNCSQITVSPEEIIVNQPVEFSFNFNPLLENFDKCKFEYTYMKQFEIFDSNNQKLLSKELISGDNKISFTPDLITNPSVGNNLIRVMACVPPNWQQSGSLIPQMPDCLECTRSFSVGTADNPGTLQPAGHAFNNFKICNQVPADNNRRTQCETCFDNGGIWTSLGCISNQDTKGIVDRILTIGISLAGGIALLIILAAAFILATSQGEPKRTSEAKEMLTHAIVGLLFIIFSITILEFIGVNILRIPEFGG